MNPVEHTSNPHHLPIREVTRRTGVHPVTLRAWERRYGLIVPQRTAKGHRLYSQDDLARIQAILTWLARGVAVSQVRELLEKPAAAQPTGNGPWDALRENLMQSIARQAERQLDEQFNGALALYPPLTLCQQLLLPLLDELQQRWRGAPFGSQLERAFFHGWLRSKLATRLYHNNRQLAGAPLLLASLGEVPLEPELWLCAWLASSGGCPVTVLEWPIPLGELALACEHIAPRALLLYASQTLDSQLLCRDLPRLAEHCSVPLLLVGAATRIHGDALRALPQLHQAADPIGAEQLLKQQKLLCDN